MTIIGAATLTWASYEYKVREAERHSRSAHELEHELNELGQAGWFLITEHNEKLIFVRREVPIPPPPDTRQAVTGTVSLDTPTSSEGDASMLTVDAAGVAKFQFDDDKGDVADAPQGDGSGISVLFSSDNPSVVSGFGATSVETDENGKPLYVASPTVVGDGTYNLSASVVNTSGAPLVDDDGATPFVQPASVPVTLNAGQATTGTTSES